MVWLAHSTRPDTLFLVAKLSQVRIQDLNRDNIELLEKAMSPIHHSSDICIQFDELDIHSLTMCAYSDVSFASNRDLTSQIGFIIILRDRSNHFHILH